MELSKQEMELFLLFPDFRLKNFFYKIFLNFINEFQTGFENRKQNYPNRKWNYFSYFLTSNQKTYFTKSFQLLKTNPKLVLKTGNRIIQTGNGIISQPGPNLKPSSSRTQLGPRLLLHSYSCLCVCVSVCRTRQVYFSLKSYSHTFNKETSFTKSF